MRMITAGLTIALSVCAAWAQTPESREPATNIEALPSGAERGVAVPGNGADGCAGAPAISGYSTWAFDFAGATTDGQGHAACLGFGSDQIWRDRWWSWTAPASSLVRVETCGQTGVDTRIAVYSPAAVCSPASEYLLACNDDACNFQSSLTFQARAGQTYLIRIGLYGFSEPAAIGAGTFTVNGLDAPDICPDTVVACQDPNLSESAYTSTASFRVADDFVMNATGAVDGICWRGSYIGFAPGTDDFTITYWTNAGGLPGTPIASFDQSAGGLSVQRADSGDLDIANNTMFVYSAKHAPVVIADNVRYWVEIRNFQGTTWYWQGSTQGNGAWQDGTPASGWSGSTARPNVTFCVSFLSGCNLDTNGDGVINFADLNNVVSFFNTNCP